MIPSHEHELRGMRINQETSQRLDAGRLYQPGRVAGLRNTDHPTSIRSPGATLSTSDRRDAEGSPIRASDYWGVPGRRIEHSEGRATAARASCNPRNPGCWAVADTRSEREAVKPPQVE